MKGDKRMYCRKCGADIGNARFCPVCGAKQEADGASGQPDFRSEAEQRASRYEPAQSGFDASFEQTGYGQAGWIGDKLRAIFRDPMFLAITILMTVSCALGSIGFSSANGRIHFSLGIIGILYVIGLWMIYASAKKDDDSFISGLSFTSGVIKAYKIVIWVVIIALLVGAVLCFIAGPTLMKTFSLGGVQFHLYDDIGSEIFDEIPDLLNHEKFGYLSNFVLLGFGIAFIIADAVLLVVNLCFIKRLHRFTKSLCDSVKTGVYEVVDAKPSKAWLIVSAVFGLLGAVSGPGASESVRQYFDLTFSSGNAIMNSIAAACTAAAAILASILIKRNFIDQ